MLNYIYCTCTWVQYITHWITLCSTVLSHVRTIFNEYNRWDLKYFSMGSTTFVGDRTLTCHFMWNTWHTSNVHVCTWHRVNYTRCAPLYPLNPIETWCTTPKFGCVFRPQFSPDAVGCRRPVLRLRSFPRGCPPQAKIFSKKNQN